MAVSPDTAWIAFIEDHQAWVAPLSATGKAVELGKDTKSIPVQKLSGRAGDFLSWQDADSLNWSRGPILYHALAQLPHLKIIRMKAISSV